TPVADGEYYPDNTIPAAIAPGSVSNRCGMTKSNTGQICSAFFNAFNSGDLNPATSFGTQERNQFLGPHYFDTDFGVVKSFPLGFENANFKFGAQLFNILNHPNFGQPNGDVNSGGFGTITNMANPPTSIFGSFLGGDASPRIVQFKGVITFSLPFEPQHPAGERLRSLPRSRFSATPEGVKCGCPTLATFLFLSLGCERSTVKRRNASNSAI
ncbi:MAG: hypothetical protein WBE41_23900, partial [Terracidiphilus sp.]